MIERTSAAIVKEVIEKDNKMAFVSGPRQVGKTTLAKHYKELFGQGLYVNWDNIAHQKKILTDPLSFERENRDPGRPFLKGFALKILSPLHLLKATQIWKATGEAQLDLNYIRDKEKKEVDFVLSEKGRPFCLIECKVSELSLRRCEKIPFPASTPFRPTRMGGLEEL